MTELSQTLTTDYRTAQGDYQRIQYIPGSLAPPQHIQLQVVQVAQVGAHSGTGDGPGWTCARTSMACEAL